MKLKSNSLFMLDAADYNYPYTEYLVEKIAKKKKIFFFTRASSRAKPKFCEKKNFFYLISDFLNTKNKFLLGIEHIISMMIFSINFFFYRPKTIITQMTPLPVIDSFFFFILKYFCEIVHTVHNSDPFHNDGNYLQRSFNNIYLKNFKRFICHSEQTRLNLINKGFLKENILKFEIPIYFKNLKYKEIKKKNINKFNILFFGLIRKYKGLDILIKAIPKIKTKKKFNVTVAGKQMMNLKNILNFIKKKKIKRIVNWKIGYKNNREISKLFNDADLVVLPYKNIDASGILNLCFAFRTPVLVSDLKSFKYDYKSNDGITYAKKNNINDFANKISHLINSKKNYLKQLKNIKKKNKKINKWNTVSENIINFIR